MSGPRPILNNILSNPSLSLFHFCLCSNETKSEDAMNISQEILVLDFGDEKREFFKADPSTDFAKGKCYR